MAVIFYIKSLAVSIHFWKKTSSSFCEKCFFGSLFVNCNNFKGISAEICRMALCYRAMAGRMAFCHRAMGVRMGYNI